MAVTNNFVMKFVECDRLFWQDLTVIDNVETSGQERLLQITFPDGSVLSFADGDVPSAQYDPYNDFPPEDDLETLLGSIYTVILPRMSNWGFEDDRNAVELTTDYVKAFVAQYPDAYRNADGDNIDFDYDTYPSGVYTFDYQFVNDPGDQIPPEDPIALYSKSARLYNSCELDACLTTAFEDMKNANCEGDGCEKVQALQNKLIRVIIMTAAASIDFTNGRFTEANNKLRAAEVLCRTGICQYHHGC